MDGLQRKATRGLESVVRAVLVAASLLALVAMAGLLLAGLVQLGLALGYGLGLRDWRVEFPNAAVACIKTALKGLELFFLAPLPYVVLRAIRRHAESPRAELADPRVRDELVTVKTFSLTLILALVASALAERALTEDGLSYEPALSGAAVILVLGLFIIGLKRTLHAPE